VELQLRGLVLLSPQEMMDKLDKEYPNVATVLLQMNDLERIVYLAKVELIESMKMWNEPPKKRKG